MRCEVCEVCEVWLRKRKQIGMHSKSLRDARYARCARCDLGKKNPDALNHCEARGVRGVPSEEKKIRMHSKPLRGMRCASCARCHLVKKNPDALWVAARCEARDRDASGEGGKLLSWDLRHFLLENMWFFSENLIHRYTAYKYPLYICEWKYTLGRCSKLIFIWSTSPTPENLRGPRV